MIITSDLPTNQGGTMGTTAPLVTYTDGGEPYDDHHAEIIRGHEADLLSGAVFARHAASDRSVIGYAPPTSRDVWSHAISTVGRMAAESDALAQVAAAIVGRVNLYQTNHECHAQVWEGAAIAIRKGYDDVIGRSGPEPGRHKDHQRPFNIHEIVQVAYWLNEATARGGSSAPAIGWCLDAIARAHRVRTPRTPSIKSPPVKYADLQIAAHYEVATTRHASPWTGQFVGAGDNGAHFRDRAGRTVVVPATATFRPVP
jgi:hypothetical protein